MSDSQSVQLLDADDDGENVHLSGVTVLRKSGNLAKFHEATERNTCGEIGTGCRKPLAGTKGYVAVRCAVLENAFFMSAPSEPGFAGRITRERKSASREANQTIPRRYAVSARWAGRVALVVKCLRRHAHLGGDEASATESCEWMWRRKYGSGRQMTAVELCERGT